MTRIPSLSALLILLAAACALAGCGSTDGPASAPPVPATLVLDFAPNAIHAGTYLATARGYDRDAGVRLAVEAPSSSTDAVKLLRAGRADLAYLDIHDLAIADERSPGSLVAVMALVQRPLAAVLAEPGVARPRALEGRRAGVSGLPSDRAVLESIVRGDGGDPGRVREVTIGFQAVPALLAGRVAAATGFWNAEGVALRRRRPARASSGSTSSARRPTRNSCSSPRLRGCGPAARSWRERSPPCGAGTRRRSTSPARQSTR